MEAALNTASSMAPSSSFGPLNSNNNNSNMNGNGNASGSGPGAGTGQAGVQQPTSGQQYTIPGILHYLQYEWQRFELERHQWDIEKAELQARIALLQGERKGQENLKNDLVRRIKMLEYCLRQERAKYHKLKYGVDPPNSSSNVDEFPQFNNDPLLDDSIMINSDGTAAGTGVNWKQGRQLLRQYLQEIGYTDTIIDVRSNRVRSLLGLNNSSNDDMIAMNDGIKGSSSNQVKQNRRQQQQHQHSPSSSLVTDTEASVLATFEFLNEQTRDHLGRESGGGNEDDEEIEDEEEDMIEDVEGRGPFAIDTETEEVLAEFNFLAGHDQKDTSAWRSAGASKSDIVDIGELAALTVANESLEINGTGGSSTALQNSINSEFRKTWNPRYILKSHFDSVRGLTFHATEPLLVTCSEDETLKLWNLNKTQQQSNKGKQQNANATSGGTTFDLEPVYTFRGHRTGVLSLALSNNTIFSGAQNGELFMWTIPSNTTNIDPYDAFDSSMSPICLEGHSDAVWSLTILQPAASNSNPILCSASADSTIKMWDTNRQQLVKKITWEDITIRPTCLASVTSYSSSNSDVSSASLLAASFTDGSISIYDVEASNSSEPILTFENGDASTCINSIVVHPTLSIIVSAHEDRQIKFWDLNSGKCLHAMVAHLDEVTCLACDPNGLYLLSGSHDCSVRLWNFDNRTCVQEITSHRKKFDEAIFDVTFHPSKPYFASAGADALAKVFV